MVRLHARTIVILLLPLLLVLPGSCGLLTVTPFPDFLGQTDLSVDLTEQIRIIANGETGVRYDLAVVSRPGREPRVILLVEPPSSDLDEGFIYRGQVIVLDEQLRLVGVLGPETSLDYFGRPYAYAHDGNILVSYSVIDPNAQEVLFTVPSARGIEGYALDNGSETYLFAQPSGDYAAFDLTYSAYATVGLEWGFALLESNSLNLSIIPDDQVPSSDASNFDQLGFQLIGLNYDQPTDQVTFMLSEPSQGRIVAARTYLTSATSGTGVLLEADQSWPIAIAADRPDLHVDAEGFFLLRRDGWLERYQWSQTGDLTLVDAEGNAADGPVTRIVGDRYLARQYAFLVRADDQDYMYRFDESSGVLTRYGRWW
jgi:hypothetical protein